jgi:hypothetical protein
LRWPQLSLTHSTRTYCIIGGLTGRQPPHDRWCPSKAGKQAPPEGSPCIWQRCLCGGCRSPALRAQPAQPPGPWIGRCPTPPWAAPAPGRQPGGASGLTRLLHGRRHQLTRAATTGQSWRLGQGSVHFNVATVASSAELPREAPAILKVYSYTTINQARCSLIRSHATEAMSAMQSSSFKYGLSAFKTFAGLQN